MFSVLFLLIIASCGSPTSGSTVTPDSRQSAGTTAATAIAPTVGIPTVVDADRVPAAARAAYLAGLRQIDAGLVANEDRAIRRAANICLDIAQGKDEQTVVTNTVKRLSGGNATIDASQAARAVALARQHICTA